MEEGSLDATRVSTRVLDALADLLGTSADDLRRTGALGGPAPAAASSAAFFRTDDHDAERLTRLEVLADAMLAGQPEPWDEVDDAFQGGDG
jgi:hypothetical protein